MKILILLTAILITTVGNAKPGNNEIVQLLTKVYSAYSHSDLQLSYQLKTYLKQTVIQESRGHLMRRGDRFYKEMDLVTMITDGDYAITIDRRIMTVFYQKNIKQPMVQNIMPNLNKIDLRIVSANGRQTLVRNTLLSTELDSSDYYVNSKTGTLELVRHYKTYEGDLYRTDILYDNQKVHEMPEKSLFDLNQWITGKGKRAKLNKTAKNQGFTFVNTLKKQSY